jgi:hypothetical protein
VTDLARLRRLVDVGAPTTATIGQQLTGRISPGPRSAGRRPMSLRARFGGFCLIGG